MLSKQVQEALTGFPTGFREDLLLEIREKISGPRGKIRI
jgi:hypothetical protein